MTNNIPTVWVSHSSIGDFLKCHRLYFLKNVYKDPQTGRKITIINPHMALGQTVHEVVEALSVLKVEDRFKDSLIDKYNHAWEQVTGELGGFHNLEEEKTFKEKGAMMIQRILDHPGPILNKAIKLSSPDTLPPRFLLSEQENILLCGKIDWLEYIPEYNSVHIIDFKTGRNEEDEDSLQLPIYYLLVRNLQKRTIGKMSYWYLNKDNCPKEFELPDPEEALKRIIDIAVTIKHARINQDYKCKRNGCYACGPFEAILNKKAKFIGATGYQDRYVIN